MNEEVKKWWIEALLAPDAKQVKGHMETAAGRCCLGVLCRVAEAHGVKMKIEPQEPLPDNVVPHVECTEFNGEGYVLPEAVVEWAGLLDPNPTVDAYGSESLAECNDNGCSFVSIAGVIEEQL